MTTGNSENNFTENIPGNVKHKNSVFTLLFSNPDVLRELYSAIEGVDLPPDIPIDINTLSNVLYMGKLNDISFTIDNRLVVLIEHQSTINENMPLRLLIYVAHIYERIIHYRKLYQTKLEKIPVPEFIVLYNGKEPFSEHKELRLSDAFLNADELKTAVESLPLELIVQVYNINYGYNPQMLERSKNLGDYSIFVEKVREYRKRDLSLAESIKAAVKYCIENNILKEFLEANSSEVLNMIFQEWDWDEAKEVWQEEAREEERAKADAEKLKIAQNLKNMGLSLEQIVAAGLQPG